MIQNSLMKTPRASRPYWPDALETFKDATSGLKDWSWAVERLEQSHNYWIATSGPDGPPHLMVVWGLWWRDAFWFSTGRSTRKARNLAANSRCMIATEKADEAVIVEGLAVETPDRATWKEIIPIYDRKYGGDLGPLLEKSNSTIFRVEPQVIFAQDENAENFAESVTRWTFK
jgi:hypothetical protein